MMTYGGVFVFTVPDFVLPEMPWFTSALSRAEQNNINFGFGLVTCLTVEDVILSKLFSFKNDQSRFNDLDDLKSIFLAKRPLDLAYLSGQMQRLNLVIPKPIRGMAPEALYLGSRKPRRAFANNLKFMSNNY